MKRRLMRIFKRLRKAREAEDFSGADETLQTEASKSEGVTNGSQTFEEENIDPFNPFPYGVAIELTDVLDLHAFAPRDVRRVVEEYLSEARELGFRQIRIVHGKGVGVQREIVRKVLERTPFVEHFSDAPPEAGGWGATIARLSE